MPLLLAIMTCNAEVVLAFAFAFVFDGGCPSRVKGGGTTGAVAFLIEDASDNLTVLQSTRGTTGQDGGGQNFV